ncbi:hypothetical protein Tco_1106067 [Tanacetum coccineum]
MFVEFVIQNQFFSFSLEEFAQVLDVPCEGACVFTDRWRLDELAYGIPSDGPYQTNLPFVEDIISSIRINRDGQVCRIRHEKEIDVLEYQVLTRKIEPTLKPLEEIIWEKVFCLGVIGIMENPELENESYVLYDRVMTPLAAQLERKPRRDRGMRRGRHSTSSSSAFDQPSSSHLNDDDDDGNDEGTSRASTPSPIRYVNSLTNQVPQVFQNPPNIDPHLEPFYTRQTKIINRQVQLRDEQRGGPAPPSPIYVPFVSEPVYPEFLPEDDVLPAEEQPLPVAASPTTESPGYIPESDPEEDPEEDDEEDPADYPADRGDDRDDEEPSDDDDDDDDDAEEEEHLAPADPAAVAYSADQDPYLAYRVTARMSIRPQAPAPFLSEEVAERLLALPTPPPSPLSPYSSPLPQIPLAINLYHHHHQ